MRKSRELKLRREDTLVSSNSDVESLVGTLLTSKELWPDRLLLVPLRTRCRGFADFRRNRKFLSLSLPSFLRIC